MNRHLSLQQIAKYLSGNTASVDLRHIEECEMCRGDLVRFESSLVLFRTCVHEWSVEMTAKPFARLDSWGLYQPQKKSWILSLAFQSLAVAILFAMASSPTVRQAARQAIEVYAPDLAAYQPETLTRQGGGGGGDRSVLPASKGKLPRAALKQFTPPSAVLSNSNPKLTMEPTILAPPDIPLPQVPSNNYGDPLNRLGAYSNGPGSGGGIGIGASTGVGPGTGLGAGPGSYGGIDGSVFRPGRGVSAPTLLYKVEPEYSEEARKAKYQGTVVLKVIVDSTGRVVNPSIVRSLGLGLDEKAVEAVRKWRFRPGFKDGKPVPVTAEIEVSFRLL